MLKQQTALIAQICRDAGFDAIGNQHGIVSVGLKNRAVKPIELESVLSDELDNQEARGLRLASWSTPSRSRTIDCEFRVSTDLDRTDRQIN
jgi:hypothetical protein